LLSSQIDTLHIAADTIALVARTLVLFRDDTIPSSITHLTLDVDDFEEDPANGNNPLGVELARSADLLPALRSLSLPAPVTCFPVLSTPANFERLTTLVIIGPFTLMLPNLYQICVLLCHTPQLETFYCKTSDIWSAENVEGIASISPLSNLEVSVPIPILLPKLTTAAVTVTGIGGDILACIDTPALRSLHLNGSRNGLLSEIEWSELLHSQFLFTLRQLALRSPRLRRLAVTEAALSRQTWHWLLCGDPPDIRISSVKGVPFPDLETLAVRDFAATTSCGLDNAVLERYTAKPGVTILRRFVLRRCMDISGDVLISALRSICKNESTSKGGPDDGSCTYPLPVKLEIEIVACPGIEDRHLAAMEDLGIQVRYEADRVDLNASARRAEHEWWECRRELIARTFEYTQEDWEEEPARDEEPWWILDMKSLDPLDSQMF
jgi:hypothetical protein